MAGPVLTRIFVTRITVQYNELACYEMDIIIDASDEASKEWRASPCGQYL